jgi:hypothetical protein
MTVRSAHYQAVDSGKDVAQYSLKKLVVLHLAPAGVILVFYLLPLSLVGHMGGRSCLLRFLLLF